MCKTTDTFFICLKRFWFCWYVPVWENVRSWGYFFVFFVQKLFLLFFLIIIYVTALQWSEKTLLDNCKWFYAIYSSLYCFCFCSFLLMSCKVMERSPLNNRHLLVLCFCYSQSKTWFNAIFLIRYHLTQVIILHWFNVGELDFVHNLAILKLSGLWFIFV